VYFFEKSNCAVQLAQVKRFSCEVQIDEKIDKREQIRLVLSKEK
jgi:hypothetical protein